MRPLKAAADLERPRSMRALRLWVHEHLRLPDADEVALLEACESVVARQRDILKDARQRAIRTRSRDFATTITDLQRELSTKDDVAKDIVTSFEAMLQSHRDPKTNLLGFSWFMERLEWFLGFEQRLRWCAVGLVDIANFKWYKDTVGDLVGDRIIARVARILGDEIRSGDLLAGECRSSGQPGHQDLHARFGGDEFCFLIPDVFSFDEASGTAERFKTVVERYDWATEHPTLVECPVKVDVGMVCLQLGPLAERLRRVGYLARELIQRADQVMYSAKNEHAASVRAVAFRLDAGKLVEVFGCESAAQTGNRTEPLV
jgi:diguanylate cyclase (GGDEF)-like protein